MRPEILNPPALLWFSVRMLGRAANGSAISADAQTALPELSSSGVVTGSSDVVRSSRRTTDIW